MNKYQDVVSTMTSIGDSSQILDSHSTASELHLAPECTGLFTSLVMISRWGSGRKKAGAVLGGGGGTVCVPVDV